VSYLSSIVQKGWREEIRPVVVAAADVEGEGVGRKVERTELVVYLGGDQEEGVWKGRMLGGKFRGGRKRNVGRRREDEERIYFLADFGREVEEAEWLLRHCVIVF
jgi:hypothetical protein